jgi:tetratricopeptide (TPR) repeat protein
MYCRRAMELDPHFHRAFWFLGLSHVWVGRFQEAEDALKRGLELCPGRAFRSRLLGALGYAYGRWGKSQAALDVRRELEGMRPAAYMPIDISREVLSLAPKFARALTCLEHTVTTRETTAFS